MIRALLLGAIFFLAEGGLCPATSKQVGGYPIPNSKGEIIMTEAEIDRTGKKIIAAIDKRFDELSKSKYCPRKVDISDIANSALSLPIPFDVAVKVFEKAGLKVHLIKVPGGSAYYSAILPLYKTYIGTSWSIFLKLDTVENARTEERSVRSINGDISASSL